MPLLVFRVASAPGKTLTGFSSRWGGVNSAESNILAYQWEEQTINGPLTRPNRHAYDFSTGNVEMEDLSL